CHGRQHATRCLRWASVMERMSGRIRPRTSLFRGGERATMCCSMAQPDVDSPLSPDELEVSWWPSAEYVARSNLKRFMDRHGLSSYAELVRWSTDDVSRFWDAVSRDLDLEWYSPYQQVLDLSRGVKWPRWWTGGSFNYVHNAIDKHAIGSNRNKV